MRKMLIAKGVVEPDEKEMKEMGPPKEPEPDPIVVATVNRLVAQTQKDQASTQKTQLDTMTAAQAAQMKPAEFQKIIEETVAIQLDNLLKARDLTLGPGRVRAMELQAEREAGA
jgi:hypothetical protein